MHSLYPRALTGALLLSGALCYLSAEGTKAFTPQQRKWWAFQKVSKSPVPAVNNKPWVRNEIDAFVLARLEKKNLKPNPAADRTTLLRRITLDIHAGEFVTFMGPSGAGKSTLLSIIGMLDSMWSGEYYFLDQPVHKLNVKKRNELHKANIGFVFQSYHLIDNLTVFENLEIPLSYKNVPHKERISLVCDVLDRFNIVGKKDLFPNQLSGGQQQLVGVARAVIQNPKLILADEPTGNLHSAQGEEIMQLFKRLNDAGTTIIQVTHSERNATFGNRIIQLKDGWVVSEEPAARVG